MRTSLKLRPILAVIIVLTLVFAMTGEGWAVSSVQKNFKVNDGLAIKADHSLWALYSGKKITTGVKEAYAMNNGYLILKRNGKLQYKVKLSSGSWSTKTLLTDVRELADRPYVDNYSTVYVYAVKKNDKLMKGTIKFNSSGTKVTGKSWKKILGNVAHCYLSNSEYWSISTTRTPYPAVRINLSTTVLRLLTRNWGLWMPISQAINPHRDSRT